MGSDWVTTGRAWAKRSTVPGVVWWVHDVNSDDRGSFTEAFRVSAVPGLAQVNVSVSLPGVLRGMHWHEHQWDYWFVASGSAQVQVVGPGGGADSLLLTRSMGVSIPPMVAHGFLALQSLVLVYGVTAEYNHEAPDEYGYHPWSGPALFNYTLLPDGADVVMSDRDANAPHWRDSYHVATMPSDDGG